MLLLLLVLVTVNHMTVAQLAPETVNSTVTWFAVTRNQQFISSSDDGTKAYICFEGYWNESDPNLCLWTETTADHKFTKADGGLGMFILYMNTTRITFDFSTSLNITSNTNGRAMTVYSQAGPPGTIFEKKTVNGSNPTVFSVNNCYDGEIALRSGNKACTADGKLLSCTDESKMISSPCKLCKDGECLINNLCTVTGNQVQNLNGKVVTIPDRCTYDMAINRNLYSVKAFFREHRRKDVSVLDALELTGKATVFLFRQGQVKVNGSVVNLTSSVSLDGANISKTSSGFSFIAEHFRMYFKGDAATIGIPDDHSANYSGVCNSSTPESNKDNNLSEDGCDTVLTETNDTTINCTEIKQHCGLLNSSILSSCFSIAEGNELMKMCENFLCKYPSVDTARCMFHETLAMTCDLLEKPVANWRNQTQCEATAGKCVDTFCAENEFCALEDGKETCLCRAVFASRYRPNNTFGEPTVCSESSGSLSLALCLLKEKNIHYDKLQLIDPNCTGLVNKDKGLLTFSFNSTDMCGTNVTVENDSVMHKNKVMLSNTTSGLITRADQFELDFSCFYSMPQVQTVGLKIKDSSVMATITAGNWTYNLSMKAYGDKGRTKALTPGDNITLDQTVWVELRTEGLDQDLVKLVTDSCWATSEADTNSTLKYELVKMGCANTADESVTVHQNGLGTFNYFSFNTFKFSGTSSSDLYLHCEVSLCVNDCAPTCNNVRRRRSLRKGRSLISMFWAD